MVVIKRNAHTIVLELQGWLSGVSPRRAATRTHATEVDLYLDPMSMYRVP